MDRLRGLAGHPKVVAIGETGLDFYYEHSPRQVQRDMFERFVALAVETGLPIVVHNRESDREVAETIRNRGGGSLEGVIHCFTSDTAAARTFLEPRLLPVVLGHRHLQECRGAAGRRPLGSSGPAAHRDRLAVPGACSPAGRRNEPAYVRFVAETLARVRGIEVDEIAEAASRNARTLFRLPAGETVQES